MARARRCSSLEEKFHLHASQFNRNLGATESNTPRTRRALWGPGTKWKPKCVVGMAPDQNLIDKFTWTLWSPFCGDSELSANGTLLPVIKRAHSAEAEIIPAE